MRRLLLSRQADLLIVGVLAAAAATWLGADPNSQDCVNGTTLYYQTAYGSTALADTAPPPPSLVPRCGKKTPEAVILYSDNGSKGLNPIVVSTEAVTRSYEQAVEALSDAKPLPAAPSAALPAAYKDPLPNPTVTPEAPVGQSGTPQCLGILLPNEEGELRSPHLRPRKPEGPSTPAPGRAPASQASDSATPATPTTGPGAPVIAPSADSRPDPISVELPPTVAGGALSQSNNNLWATLAATSEISDTARGNELILAANQAREAIRKAASEDQQVLAQAYRDLSPEAMASYLERAEGSLGRAAEIIESAKESSLEKSDRARFRNFYLNARDKAQLARDSLLEDRRQGLESPLLDLTSLKDANPLAKTQALAALFGTQLTGANPTSTDSLVNRMVMLGGLPAEQKTQALQKLKLLEKPNFKFKDGSQLTLDIPHNGYILGGGSTAVDCSSFVSSVLPADVRRGRFTTLDFRSMWIYGRTRQFPKPPRYERERAELVKATAAAFKPIDLYAGETLAVGDILVYRLRDEPVGHVVIVRSYNAATMRAEVTEAAQTSGTIENRTINLSPDPLSARRRLLLPGLWALRLRPVSNQACYYRDSRRAPASPRSPQAPSQQGVAR